MKEPMQRIVEAAGEKACCTSDLFNKHGDPNWCFTCSVCGSTASGIRTLDPTDLNELFRLAEKATPWEVKLTQSGEQYICYFFSTPFTCEVEVKADTPAEALLNALDKAIGGSDE